MFLHGFNLSQGLLHSFCVAVFDFFAHVDAVLPVDHEVALQTQYAFYLARFCRSLPETCPIHPSLGDILTVLISH